jgi:hypothetical protein
MKVGQLFDLPSHRPVGYIGNLFNSDKSRLIAKYEVVKVDGALKGRLIVVYKDKGRYKCKPKS